MNAIGTRPPKPKALPVLPDNIPAAMKARRQWVTWRYVWKSDSKKPECGKWDKPPRDARTGGLAKSDEADTWSPYEVALAAYLDPANHYDGIGYVFSGEPGDFVGCDLDHCRDPATGKINEWTEKQRSHKRWAKDGPHQPAEILDKLASYAEVSPSATGAKIIVQGAPAFTGKAGDFEMYNIKRYFTVTGHMLPGMTEIRDASDYLPQLSKMFLSPAAAVQSTNGKQVTTTTIQSVSPNAAEILKRCRASKNGGSFDRLWNGDTGGYSSHSEADLALCNILAFWCGSDASLIDQLFRQSGLFRDKWDERHSSNGTTYGSATVAKSLERRSEFYDWNKSKGKDSDQTPGGEVCAATIRRLAEEICKTEHFAQDLGKKLYVYRFGVYAPRGEEAVRRKVKSLTQKWKLDEEWSSHLANEVAEYIRVDAPHLWDRPPLDLLNVRNGLLRIADKKLLSHNPEHLTTVQLPIDFDPAATCPEIDKFISQVFPDDAFDLAFEIPAYLMVPDTSIQKAVLLLGPGGNGKSTYLEMLLKFLGKGNTSGVALHQLETDKFKASRLYGKLANICADLPSEHLAGTSVFKQITGGDVIQGEYKFKDSFDFYPFARLVFSANTAPRSKDASEGFFDRWQVIPFGRSFRGTTEEIPRDVLDARLSSPGELSGLLNKALAALPVLKSQRGFSQPQSVQDAWREFRATTDPLAVWLDRFTVSDPSCLVSRDSLRVAFNAHLEQQGRPSLTKEDFGRSFNKLRPEVESSQRTINGKRVWCYVGIGLISQQETPAHPAQGEQDNPLLNTTRARTHTHARGQEQEEEKPVHPVQPVLCESAPIPAPTVVHGGESTWNL